MGTVIRKDNTNKLVANPIIEKMLFDIRAQGFTAKQLASDNEWRFVSTAHKVHHELGGKDATRIGEPADAILLLEERLENFLGSMR